MMNLRNAVTSPSTRGVEEDGAFYKPLHLVTILIVVYIYIYICTCVDPCIVIHAACRFTVQCNSRPAESFPCCTRFATNTCMVHIVDVFILWYLNLRGLGFCIFTCVHMHLMILVMTVVMLNMA